MVELSHRERTIKVKIVYYGPALGGKTTNLQVLHEHALAARRGELVSIDSAQDRTILFDLLPLKAAGFRGFDLRLQIMAVPGQAMYAATRRLVLKGADSVVFVANSAADRWEENIQSLREMTQNLLAHQLDPSNLPLVLQYNKRDLRQVTPVELMDRGLNTRSVVSVPAVAVRGEGVLETFSAILLHTMQDLAARYNIVETARGQTLPQWTQQTVLGIFGAASIAQGPALPQPPPAPEARPSPPAPLPPAPAAEAEDVWGRPERRTVRVMLPDEAHMAGAGPDARANETLVESYAQASTQLSAAVDELREQRDLARRRLEDVQQALGASQDVLAGQPLEPTLRAVLGRMADAAGATQASFLIAEPDRRLRAAALHGLKQEPLLRVPAGVRHVTDRFLGESEPRLHHAADSLDLGDALERAETTLAAVVSVPVRTPRGLQGVALLYLTPDAAHPGPDALGHLAVISRALCSSLELARGLETVRGAERSLQMAFAGMASVRGLEEVVTCLEALGDRIGVMRREPEAPQPLQSELAQLVPSLAGALSTARSLLAFGRGEVRREPVGLDDLVASLKAPALRAHLGPGAEAVSGDAVLLRFALVDLLNQARSAAADEKAPQLWAVAEGGRVRISVAIARAPSSSPRGGEAALSLVRRIAELHGGSLTLENHAAHGPCYTLSLVPA